MRFTDEDYFRASTVVDTVHVPHYTQQIISAQYCFMYFMLLDVLFFFNFWSWMTLIKNLMSQKLLTFILLDSFLEHKVMDRVGQISYGETVA